MTLQSTMPSWEQHLLDLAHSALSATRQSLEPGDRMKNLMLDQAFRLCAAITARHSRSFFLASSLLPADKRGAMRVLYAFCRTADDLVDETVDHSAARLQELRSGIAGQHAAASDYVLAAWSAVQARYQIPFCLAEQLLDGVERDLVQWRYRSFDELSIYCYGVASTVGLMSMHITGYSNPLAIPYAIKLGVALQLTNILRDVGEDWRSGRLYLPLDELAAFGLGEPDIAAGRVDERWREWMRFQIARARRLYAESLPGIALLHPDGRMAVAAAALLYQGILDDIEAHDFDVFTRRAHVNPPRKLGFLLQAFRVTQNLKNLDIHPGQPAADGYPRSGIPFGG